MDLENIKDMMTGILDVLEKTKAAGNDPDKFVKKGMLHLRNTRDHMDMDT